MKHSPIYFSLFIFLLSFSLCACSQDSAKPVPQVHQHQFVLGTTTLPVKETRYTTKIPIRLIQLHSNETTAGEVTTAISEELGIDYLQIINEGKRLVDFQTKRQSYRFDPNRIFSKEGITASLKLHGQYSDEAFKAVSFLRDSLLQLLDKDKTIVAVHNNTDGNFSLFDYQKNGTGVVHQNSLHDADDFFITNDSTIFRRLKEKHFNVVLEYAGKLKDDGSLSIYCSRNNIRYVNVEAEHGHAKEQAEMLRTLIQILK